MAHGGICGQLILLRSDTVNGVAGQVNTTVNPRIIGLPGLLVCRHTSRLSTLQGQINLIQAVAPKQGLCGQITLDNTKDGSLCLSGTIRTRAEQHLQAVAGTVRTRDGELKQCLAGGVFLFGVSKITVLAGRIDTIKNAAWVTQCLAGRFVTAVQRGGIFLYADTSAMTAVASDNAPGWLPQHALAPDEYSGWRPLDATTTATLTVTFPAATTIDSIGLAGFAMDGALVTVAISSDGWVTSRQIAETELTADSDAIFFSAVTTSAISLTLTERAAEFCLFYLCPCVAQLLPALMDGHDPDIYQADGTQHVAPSGKYVGSVQHRAELTLSLDFGLLDQDDYAEFIPWAETCVTTLRPFFYIPDFGDWVVWFGSTDAGYKFSAPVKAGLRQLGRIPYRARI